MKTKSQADLIREEILLLEDKKSLEQIILKEQFRTTLDSFKPLNMVKNTWQDITASSEIKNDIVGNLLGLATGYVSKKIMLGATHNPIKRAAGTILQFAIAKLVSSQSDNIRNKGEEWLNKFFTKNADSKVNSEMY